MEQDNFWDQMDAVEFHPPSFISQDKWGLWFSCLDQIISSDSIVRSFCHDTNKDDRPIKNILDTLYKNSSVSEKEMISAFIAWYNVNWWGPF